MVERTMTHRIGVIAAAAFFVGAGLAGAQGRPGETATDPIRCWWKADRTAVRVGERFRLVLTCAVIETTATTVVPVVNQLEPGAIILTPFEAVSGIRRDDVVVPPWRYLQYEYTMRLMSEGFFGQDIAIPSLTVTYNLQGPGGNTQGRDQSYLLPPIPMRVLSLVPRMGSDIRDASGQTFEGVETRRFRATAALVGASIAFAFAAVLGAVALARAGGRLRARDPKVVKPLPLPAVLRGCLRSLSDVRSEAAAGGWTPELTRRALAALRVAAALALGRPVTQDFVTREARQRSGQLTLRTGLLRRKRAVLSAPTTAMAVATRLQQEPPAGVQARVNLEQIGDALKVFGAASYGRAPEPDGSALNTTLDNAVDAIRRLRVSALWPMRTANAMARAVTGLWT